MTRPSLVLGSASPRRRELLATLGIVPDRFASPDIDETPHEREKPADYVRRMAQEKAAAIDITDGEVLLCADTTVAMGRRILGKPDGAEEARAFLRKLSGRRHKVITAVAVRTPSKSRVRVVETKVKFKRLSRDELDGYVASNEWIGKTGGYGIQGLAAAFVPWIEGSYTAVVGLPLAETATLLGSAGYSVVRA